MSNFLTRTKTLRPAPVRFETFTRAKTKVRRQAGEQGSAIIEFMLCSLVWVPLILGTAVVGLNLIRAIQVTEVCRDAGHMYSYGVDFSQSSNQNLIVSLAQGLNMTTNSGNGVVILSTLTYIGENECPNGQQPNGASCPNYKQIVITQRFTIGNSTLTSSSFGNVTSSMIDPATGNLSLQTYLTNPNAVATGFSSLINLNASGQYSYVSEMYVSSPDYNYWALLGNTGVSARSIF